jgi:NADPH:quinone reductase-like Zn-dependent oxidoreductase
MKAIHLTAYGNPGQNLKMVEVSEPNVPSAGEALVRMEYAPIDYSDLLLSTGVYFLNPSFLLSLEVKVRELWRRSDRESPASR